MIVSRYWLHYKINMFYFIKITCNQNILFCNMKSEISRFLSHPLLNIYLFLLFFRYVPRGQNLYIVDLIAQDFTFKRQKYKWWKVQMSILKQWQYVIQDIVTARTCFTKKQKKKTTKKLVGHCFLCCFVLLHFSLIYLYL